MTEEQIKERARQVAIELTNGGPTYTQRCVDLISAAMTEADAKARLETANEALGYMQQGFSFERKQWERRIAELEAKVKL